MVIRIGATVLNNDENSFARADNLKAKAARYRWLADILFDPKIAAVVQACARELDCEAKFLEQSENR
ncbi:MAG TPA: hypothetical protein VGM72_13870, partial [Micropepsaceae bacterium]